MYNMYLFINKYFKIPNGFTHEIYFENTSFKIELNCPRNNLDSEV